MEIQIKCSGTAFAKLSDIEPMQGNLKNLSKQNYEKLKKEILDNGFISPLILWKNKLLDGHQRVRALKTMREEGIKMPDEFPVVNVDAPTETHARRLILAISSNYGEMTNDGLYEFLSDSHIGFEEMDTRFTFDAINFDKFESEFYEPEAEAAKKEKEVKTCPNCNHLL